MALRLGTVTIGSAYLLFCAVACATVASPARVPNGAWGGPGVQLSVHDQGATIEFDCAHGTLDAPLDLGPQGRFDVPGRFTREGGPEREGDPGAPVRYSGTLNGNELTLEVGFADDRVGPYTLVLGGASRLFKCK